MVEVVEAYAAKAKNAFAHIGLPVKDTQMEHMQDCSTGKAEWEKSSAPYENPGVANKITNWMNS